MEQAAKTKRRKFSKVQKKGEKLYFLSLIIKHTFLFLMIFTVQNSFSAVLPCRDFFNSLKLLVKNKHRLSKIDTPSDFAREMTQGLHLNPGQGLLFELYLRDWFGRGRNTLFKFNIIDVFALLKEHPKLSKPIIREQILEFFIEESEKPQSLSYFLKAFKSSGIRRHRSFVEITAHLSFWRSILGFPKVKINSSLDKKEKQALMRRNKEEFLAYLDTVISPRTAIGPLETPAEYHKKRVKYVYQVLNKARQKLLAGGRPAGKISQAMADLVDTAGFSNTSYIHLLKSKNPLINIEAAKKILGVRDDVAEELGFKGGFSELQEVLGVKSPSDTNEELLKIEKDVESILTKSGKTKKTFRLRPLSLEESPFRSCLSGDCATDFYFEKALDPNFIYFTLTDENYYSSGHAAVVLGSAVNSRGNRIKTAFVDKVQGIELDKLLTVLEGMRISLEEYGYRLGIPQRVGGVNGLSSDVKISNYFESYILPGLKTKLKRFSPHMHSYTFRNGYSRGHQYMDVLEFTKGAGKAMNHAVITLGEINHPRKAPKKINIKSLYKPIFELKDSEEEKHQIQFLRNTFLFTTKEFSEFKFSFDSAKHYAQSKINNTSLTFNVRKKALFALTELTVHTDRRLNITADREPSVFPFLTFFDYVDQHFNESEARQIIGEMSNWIYAKEKDYRQQWIRRLLFDVNTPSNYRLFKSKLKSHWMILFKSIFSRREYFIPILRSLIQNNELDILRLLDKAGVNFHLKNDIYHGITPLEWAKSEGRPAVVDLLIQMEKRH